MRLALAHQKLTNSPFLRGACHEFVLAWLEKI